MLASHGLVSTVNSIETMSVVSPRCLFIGNTLGVWARCCALSKHWVTVGTSGVFERFGVNL